MADLIIMSSRAGERDIQRVIRKVKSLGFAINLSRGQEKTLIGLIGDTRGVSDEVFRIMPGVMEVISILKEYKLASREFQPSDTVVKLPGVRVGSRQFAVIAGPCSVENRRMFMETAVYVRQHGANMLRGGVYKPRTSPYSFMGLGKEGLDILREVRKKVGIPVVTEVMSPEEVGPVSEVADVLQVGARNMFNYRLLQCVGRTRKPVLLKRGFEAKISEFLNCAEYILKEGNNQVILCERGIRTFDSDFARNTLDLAAVPVLKKETHLPVIVDPSHGTGRRDLVMPMARAAVAAGADGIMVEVHARPEDALSDGAQTLTLDLFKVLMKDIAPLLKVMKRTL